MGWIQCHECNGYGDDGIGWDYRRCGRCSGKGKVRISWWDRIWLAFARKLQKLSDRFGG